MAANGGPCRSFAGPPGPRICPVMQLDARHRRLRAAPPQPDGRGIVLSDRDYLIFEAINRHGPLPSTYLYELTRHLPRTRHYQTFQHRLTKLYNGYCANYRSHFYVAGDAGTVLNPNHTCDAVAYLARPKQQWAAFDAKYQPLIYDLTPLSLAVLADRVITAHPRTDPFLHRLMGACVGASIALSARRTGMVYADQERLFTHPKCPPETKAAPNPLALPIPTGTLVPDDLFALQRDKPRFYAVEIDRRTESINSDTARTAYGRKVQGYLHVLRNGTYRKHWGIPNLTVLTVTTNRLHLRHMIDYCASLGAPDLAAHFLFRSVPCFGANWKVPAIMDFFDEPWTGADGRECRIG